MKQSTDTIVMVRPDHFGFNPQTADTNPYMHTPESMHKSAHDIRMAALEEFDAMVSSLRSKGITVLVLPSRSDVVTPDAVFPNNWFSMHDDGTLVVYPMLTPNRRLERQPDALVEVLRGGGIEHPSVINLAKFEERDLILESTGSMVLDRVNKIAYAMASPRTDEEMFIRWSKLMGYERVYMRTPKSHAAEVYHTNLLMSIGTDFAVVCLEVLADQKEKDFIKDKLEIFGKEVIEISLEQVYSFCGNILEVLSKSGQKYIVVSETAKASFAPEQLEKLESFGEILSINIPVIEEVGGGGVRCMMAEVF